MKDEFKESCIRLLHSYPQHFLQACREKRWGRAKYIYDSAIRMTMELPFEAGEREELARELFGNQGCDDRLENPIDGIFPERMVSKVYLEAAIKRDMAYENESMRRFGEPPRYYAYPKYPKK